MKTRILLLLILFNSCGRLTFCTCTGDNTNQAHMVGESHPEASCELIEKETILIDSTAICNLK